jgi:alginate O-acetyltransferase complex protein AlgJ
MRVWDRILIVAFVLILAIPGAGLLLGFGESDGADENRDLAAAPVVRADWESLKGLPDAFTRYFEDHFALRGLLVRTQAELRLRALGSTPSPDVIAGRAGWFFYAADGGVEDYVVDAPMSDSDLDVWRRTLQDVQDWLTGQGIRYVFLVAPDKHQVYPELMPATIRRLREEPRMDQLVEHLRDHSTVRVLDVRPALFSAKAHERIYHLTDTHWNDRGALIAYQEVARMVGLQPLGRSDFHERDMMVPGMDLAAALALRNRLEERDMTLVPKQPRRARIVEPRTPNRHNVEARLVTEIADPSLPRAVIYRDSFTNALIPFLSEHFSRAVYLWEYDVDPAVIAAERPDVVIQQVVGRRLGNILPYNAIADLKARGELSGHGRNAAGSVSTAGSEVSRVRSTDAERQ